MAHSKSSLHYENRGNCMLKSMIEKVFGDRSAKKLKSIYPIVEEINKVYKSLPGLSDEVFKSNLQEIKKDIRQKLKVEKEVLARLEDEYQSHKTDANHDALNKQQQKLKEQTKKVLDDYLPKVFAYLKDTCRRLIGHTYQVAEHQQVWDMVPFDVQLIGGIALHDGEIAEMATGEGKTLVAVLPLFLNAISGDGAHLVTVNDYLAKRDSQWMSPVFEYHGLTVGCLQNMMDSQEKQEIYARDIVYGTNSEFGFDYLRDNMAVDKSQLVQRKLNYAIIDEVDSVLIDEARTPLIISGPVPQSKNYFAEFRPIISRLFRLQRELVGELLKQIGSLDVTKQSVEVGEILLKIKRALPKRKAFLKLLKDPAYKQALIDAENVAIRDKKMYVADEQLYFVVDERGHSCHLSEKGQAEIGKLENDLFLVNSLDEALAEVDQDSQLSVEEKAQKKEEISENFLDKNEKLHNIDQLLKAYALFNKDEEYVVQDGKVMIVDEFTGRLMPGRRFSEGLHQAIEAKESVRIENASQTFATVTIQNYFRLYNKISGMTGTAVTEAKEFGEIYNLPVLEVPTNVPITRIDYDDMIYLTRNEKYQAVINEVVFWHKQGKPVLVGTVSVDVSELLSKMLKRRKIPHNVLNAKKNAKEAEIVAKAGEPGAVTIATNMAGRGTDIKLGQGVISQSKESYRQGYNKKISEKLPYGKMMDGLHVIGTERHESRRIDRQLRGRAGRQGDPGTSRFYLSLEDNLMRLFGSDRIAPMMKRLGLKDGEAIYHPWMNRSVEKAQKRVESHNFQIRKNLLEYDQVGSSQREIIYSYRRKVLEGKSVRPEILEFIGDFVYNKVSQTTDVDGKIDVAELLAKINRELDLHLQTADYESGDVEQKLQDEVLSAYHHKVKTMGKQMIEQIERFVLLETVDELYREHLHEMDSLKEGIGLRSYGQRDPLIEYKKESFKLFEELLANITESVAKKVFIFQVVARQPLATAEDQRLSLQHSNSSAYSASGDEPPVTKQRVVEEKVGRNDPCPCGSGKKYKQCCGKKS